MAISKEMVKYVAELSRIELSNKELEKLSRQLQDILRFIDKLNKIDIKDIEPTSHILPIKNVLREDQPQTSLSTKKALLNAPLQEANSFVVPKVIE